jgi:hypothetical protein
MQVFNDLIDALHLGSLRELAVTAVKGIYYLFVSLKDPWM